MKKVFVIKDNQNHIVSRITKIEKEIVALISYRTLEPSVYLVHSSKESALKKLELLDQAKTQFGFNVEFHVEEVDWNQLIKDNLAFRKTKRENMILVEKKVSIIC